MLDLFKRKSEQDEKKPWAERLAAGLARSREKLAGALGGVFARRKLDEETLEELESALITADVGVAATRHLLDDLAARWKRAGADQDPRAVLKAALLELLAPLERRWSSPTRGRSSSCSRESTAPARRPRSASLPGIFSRRGCRCCSPPATRSAPRRASSSSVWGERNGVDGDLAGRRRPGRGDVRRDRRGEGAQRRCRARRHRRPAAHAAAPDGRDPQGSAGDPQDRPDARRTRRCSSSTRTPGRTRSPRSGRSTTRWVSPASS